MCRNPIGHGRGNDGAYRYGMLRQRTSLLPYPADKVQQQHAYFIARHQHIAVTLRYGNAYGHSRDRWPAAGPGDTGRSLVAPGSVPP